jgi:accessory colonization factor AcfC
MYRPSDAIAPEKCEQFSRRKVKPVYIRSGARVIDSANVKWSQNGVREMTTRMKPETSV